MKHGIRVSCLRELTAAALRRLLATLLMAVCASAFAAGDVVHYTGTDMLREDVTAFRPLADRVEEATLQGAWKAVELPYVIEKPATAPASASAPAPTKALRTTSWFRIRLDALQGLHEPTRFYLPRWLAAGSISVYADGGLVYRSTGSVVWNLFNHPAVFLPLALTASQPQPKIILVRFDSLAEPEAAISSAWAGPSDPMIAMATQRDWLAYQLPFMCSAAFLAVGIFSLGVWVFRRRTTDLLLFFIALTGCIRRWHFQVGVEKLPIPDTWFIWLLLVALAWQSVALFAFMQILQQHRQRWLSRAMIVLSIVFSLMTLPANLFVPDMLNLRPYAHWLLIGQGVVIMLSALWFSWRSRSLDARLLAGVYTLSWICGVYDWARLKYVFDVEGYYLTPYAAMALFLVFVVIMFRRYVGALSEVEIVNASLAQRLQSRESELASSYERLREAEHRQTLSQERQRLTQDMHDGLGSSLVSALRVVEGGRLRETDVAEVLKSCIDDLKLAIDSMEPVEADLLLLLATLRFRLGPRLASAGIALSWEITDVPALPWLDPRNALHLLRVLQEAFANILKHTRATEIRVATAVAGEGVVVLIEDNGGGFDVEKTLVESAGKGLKNQLRRAQAIGGEIRWLRGASGTRFTLWLPLDHQGALDGTQEC